MEAGGERNPGKVLVGPLGADQPEDGHDGPNSERDGYGRERVTAEAIGAVENGGAGKSTC